MMRIASSLLALSCVIAGFVANYHATAQPLATEFDGLSSSKPLGCLPGENSTTFRLFAPRATSVAIVFFKKPDDAEGRTNAMTKSSDGSWEYTENKPVSALAGTYYAYRIAGGSGFRGEAFDSTVLVADPYSRAVATKNTFRHESRTLILDPKFDTQYDWKGDKYVIPANHNTLVVYEAHVRDLTAHKSSGVKEKGSYKGLIETGKTGGMRYLKDLGVNAVEFLPIHEFGNLEPTFRDSAVTRKYGIYNDWNPQERNHWGYMTSFYFAPESYYASGGSLAPGKWSGTDARAVQEFKDLVRALHREKISVIMDVVYNHVSDFDANPLKFIDKYYYFRTDSAGNYINTSYCGNDFKTERTMARRLIVESIKYWMTEYHIDGFRFDLATMIDHETCEEILREARKINPNVILIAEPWGGNKYGPDKFSDIGWAAWNDQIRNGVKGQNPKDGLGFIFGKHQGSNTKRSEQAFITGSLREDGGLFVQKEHAMNYLESHDDETMGDFIRLGLGEVTMNTVINDVNKHAKLSPRQLALNKLAAMYLFATQGPVMIHSGQEFARSKVIPNETPFEKRVGMIDRNSYNKDDETNYINYRHALANKDLLNYYKGLIALRRVYPSAFGSATKQDITFLETGSDQAIAFRIRNNSAVKGQPKSFVVILNGSMDKSLDFALPEGSWNILANAAKVAPVVPMGTASAQVQVGSSSGMILAQ
jgi:pullulanase/glycogen debranching enzyme